jgi:outer membrane lipoprotein-sorting protein
MRLGWGKFVLFGLVALVVGRARPAFAAGDLKATLAKLDAAAAHFHTLTADFEFDSIQTEPVPDTDVQKGVVYYRREGSTFQMGIHINNVNGQKVPKVIICCQKGAIQLYEEKLNQVTTLSKLNQYESWFSLGFGASGKDLAEKWNITDEGPETVSGIKAEKLVMIPKDPAVRRNVPKVTLWMDLNRGVSIKQVFDEGQGQSRVAAYWNFKMNQSLPRDAFSFKTNKQTAYVNR